MIDKKISKLYFIKLIIIAALLSAAVFIYFTTRPQQFKSTGKFSLSTNGLENSLNIYDSVSVNLTTTVTEGIQSRIFVKQMLDDAKITYNSEAITNPGAFINAEVIKDSNIITVEIRNHDKDALANINNSFLQTLQNSQIIKSQYPAVTVQIVDPLYTTDKPFAPQPLKYACLAFVAIIFVGSLFYYSFLSPDEYFISEGF